MHILVVVLAILPIAAHAAEIRKIEPPEDPRLRGILSDVTWNTRELTFWFPSAPFQEMPPDIRFVPLAEPQRKLVRLALRDMETFSGLRFTETSGPALLTFGGWHQESRLGRVDAKSRDGSGQWVDTPGQTWIGRRDAAKIIDTTPGSYATRWFRHEMGHIVGLEHPHNNRYRYPAPIAVDNLSHTVMGYRLTSAGIFGLPYDKYVYPTSYMSLDILALQHLYGANWDTNSGDTTYKFSPDTGDYWINDKQQPGNPTGKLFLTLWDGGGTDTLDFSAYDTDGTFDLRPGHFSTPSQAQRIEFEPGEKAEGSISMPFLPKGDPRALFENIVVGNGDNTIALNYADNHVRLGSGRNRVVVYPGTGSDEIVGFGEDDVLDLCPYHVADEMVHVDNDGADALVTIDQWPDDQIRIVGLAAHDLDARIECDEKPAGWLTTILSLVPGRH